MEYFKKKYTVIWFDYRGHHRSEVPHFDSLTIPNIARDIQCILQEVGVSRTTILGHSMGVNLVLEFYRQYPEFVKAMVLANGCARGPLETLMRSNLMQLLFPLVDKAYKHYPRLANFFWRAQGKSKITPWLVGQLGFNPTLAKESDIETYIQMLAKMDFGITLRLLKDYEDYDATPWLHEIDVPTLIISGENDLIIPKEAQEMMHQLIPDSEFQVIRKGSHCPQMDIPELVNAVIERFLNQSQSPA